MTPGSLIASGFFFTLGNVAPASGSVNGMSRPHQSLGGKTPAMAAGLEDHVWTVNELIGLLAQAEAVPIKRGSYRKTRERKAELRGEISN